jgi:SNF2 family DNA or RNA helicase
MLRIPPTDHESFIRKSPKPLCPLNSKFRLMPHQVLALNMMLKNPAMIYADKPGLGKTPPTCFNIKILAEDWVQEQASSIGMTTNKFYTELRKKGRVPVERSNLQILIICDAGIVHRWIDDFKKISPEFYEKHVWHCPTSLLKPKKMPRASHLVGIVTYSLVQRALSEWADYKFSRVASTSTSTPPSTPWPCQRIWKQVVLDEAHRLSNADSGNGSHKGRGYGRKTFEAIRTLESNTFLAITGTPVQQKISDLLSMAAIIMSATRLPPTEVTTDSPVNPSWWKKRSADHPDVKEWCKKFILSRTQTEVYNLALVARDIPAMNLLKLRQINVFRHDLGEMHPIQKDAISTHCSFSANLGGQPDIKANNINTLGMIGYLQRISVSPFLVPESPMMVTASKAPLKALSILENGEEMETGVPEDSGGARHSERWKTIDPILLYETSPMIKYIVDIVRRAIATSKKVVIFNTEVQALQLFRRVLTSPITADGDIVLKPDQVPLMFSGEIKSLKRRSEVIKNFQTLSSHETPVILVSTRAGCCGLDLSAGSIAIMTNHGFNPIPGIQAMERINRVGQMNDIELHYPRFHCAWSLDPWIAAIHRKKLKDACSVAPHLTERADGFELCLRGKLDSEDFYTWLKRLEGLVVTRNAKKKKKRKSTSVEIDCDHDSDIKRPRIEPDAF